MFAAKSLSPAIKALLLGGPGLQFLLLINLHLMIQKKQFDNFSFILPLIQDSVGCGKRGHQPKYNRYHYIHSIIPIFIFSYCLEKKK